MRKVHHLIASAGLLGSAGVLSAGCVDFVAEYYTPLTNPALATDAGGGDAGPLPACIPSESAAVIADTCGVFVSPNGDDANAGTKEAPFKTITAALGKGTTIYACAGAMPFSEMLTVPAGATIYGGLDCTSWKYVGATTKTTITASAGQVPVTLAMGNGTTLADLHVLAADASMMNDGTSSIALVANGATAELDGCVLEAQGAAAGLAGMGYTSAATAGMMGMPGADACMGAMVFGGASVSSGCGTPDSTSGLGGVGSVMTGGNGSNGLPGTTMNSGTGEGGSVCTPGTVGDAGTPGTPGLGATGVGSIAGGSYIGTAGTDGALGAPGQGGGGGGGAKGGTAANQCATASTAGGASGGSGGSGGCGGAGGKGGSAGGSSIALVSLNATLTFANVTLKAGSGGVGGDGGAGQNGGTGGVQGAGGKVSTSPGLNPGCSGGPGGLGGPGGKGGGGTGGHSLGIASTGTVPAMSGWTATTATAGAGGKGDDTMGNMGDGSDGMAANCWDFVNNAACK